MSRARLRLSLALPLWIAISAGAAFAQPAGPREGCDVSAFRSAPPSETRADPRAYFVMPRLFGDGTLDAVTSALPSFRGMENTMLWISPVHSQVACAPDHCGVNNHGYWPSSHADVAADLGGDAALDRLIAASKASNLRLCLDIPINHFGYGDRHRINGREVSVADARYFEQPDPANAVVAPRDLELWNLIGQETDPGKARQYQKEIAGRPLFGLPGLNHSNPEVVKYLVDSYAPFIDRGIDAFRIDAVKHLDLDFLVGFMNALIARGRAQGRRITFLLEFSIERSHALDLFAKDLLAAIDDRSSVLFLDFPLTFELRRLQDPGYQLRWLNEFVQYRQANRHSLVNYIPMIENHDGETPIRDPFIARLAYGLSEMVSANPTILHHGLEAAGAAATGRERISQLNPEGDLATLRNAMSDALKPYRDLASRTPVVALSAEDHSILLRRSHPEGRSFFFAANKSDAAIELSVPAEGPDAGSAIRVVHAVGGAELSRRDPGEPLRISLPARSFIAFEETPSSRAAGP